MDPDINEMDPDPYEMDPYIYEVYPDPYETDPDLYEMDTDPYETDPDNYRNLYDGVGLRYLPQEFCILVHISQ